MGDRMKCMETVLNDEISSNLKIKNKCVFKQGFQSVNHWKQSVTLYFIREFSEYRVNIKHNLSDLLNKFIYAGKSGMLSRGVYLWNEPLKWGVIFHSYYLQEYRQIISA